MPVGITSIPVELTSYFLVLAVFGGSTDYWSIVVTRRAIMATSPEWLEIVNSSAGLWGDLMVAPNVHVDCLSDSLRRSGSRPLRVHLSFRMEDLVQYHGRTTDTIPTTSLLDCRMSIIAVHSPRWESLHIETDRTNVMQYLHHLFANLEVPLLRSISAVYFHHSQPDDSIIDHPLAPIDWFKHHAPRLEALALQSISLLWSGLPAFSSIRHLTLFHIPEQYHPTFGQYKALIESSPVLEYLASRGVGCADMHLIRQESSIVSRSIRTLDFEFNSDVTMGLLVPFFIFPGLRRVALHLSSSSDILYALGCADLFASATYLEMSGSMVANLAHLQVFDMFRRLTWLDLSRAGMTVFSHLVDASVLRRQADGLTLVMPCLRTLVLAYESPALIRHFVVLHGAQDTSGGGHMTLRCVRSVFPTSSSFDTASDMHDRAWVSEHIVAFEDSGPESSASTSSIMSVSVTVLPIEVTAYFIALAIFGGEGDYWSIVGTRRTIMASSPEWLDVVNSSSAFWVDIMVSPNVRVDCLSDSLLRSGSRALRVHVSFRLEDLNRYIGRTADALTSTTLLERRMSLVLVQVARWNTVRVETDRRSVMQILRRAFRELDAPALRHISVVYFHDSHPLDIFSDHPLSQTNWFKQHVPDLESLSLRSASMLWSSLPPFLRLRRVSLYNIPHRFHPTFAQYKALVESSPSLEYLALRQVGCADVDLIREGACIFSPSILSLDLDFSSDTSMGSLVPSFVFPNLRRVVLHLASCSDVVYALACGDLFGSARYLELSGSMVLSSAHLAFFLMFPLVTCLDLSCAGSAMFTQLVVASARHRTAGITTVMPALQTLVLAYEPPRMIRDFVVLHGALEASTGRHMTLQCVRTVFPSGSTFVGVADIYHRSWVADHIVSFEDRSPDQFGCMPLVFYKWNVFPHVY
ncbi:hypothetical protein B0H11DRAFT_1899297 [Mycena galericulata]|nr:hypothetical protein B0H11DRAFT_1899297 [Mycena galericulata]